MVSQEKDRGLKPGSYCVDGDEDAVDEVGLAGLVLQPPVGPVAQEAVVGLTIESVAT